MDIQSFVGRVAFISFLIINIRTKWKGQKMCEYRRNKMEDTWHWIEECSDFPQGKNVIRRSSKPISGVFCHECIRKSKIIHWCEGKEIKRNMIKMVS